MKKLSLLILLFITSIVAFAQEFTPPDTAAIRKNKVKSVKIYYTGTGSKHYITYEYRYDKTGKCVYWRDGTAPYYYYFTHTEKGQIASSFQRTMQGTMIQGHKMDYTSDGKLFHMQAFTERDTVNPATIYTYDTARNVIEESHFDKGKLIRNYKTGYDLNKKIIHRVDSTPGKSVYEAVNSKQIRQTYYNENNVLIENCLIYYDEKDRLNKTVCTNGKTSDTYTVIYENEVDYHVLMNGKKIGKEEYVKWDRNFRWLMPRPKEEEFGLPYSDPVAKMEYKHELKRDKKGNITKDIVTGAYSYMGREPVEFDYEYEYW